MFGGIFRVLRVEGALVHVRSISWCFGGLKIGALEIYKYTFSVVSVDLNVYNALMHI